MAHSTPALHAQIIAALERSDETYREARTNRTIWMSQHNERPGIILGTDEALGVLSEAEHAFREGHFISVILLSLAYIEHELSDTLIRKSLAKFGVTLNDAIKLAKTHQVLEESLIERVDQLRLVRNPFSHLKQPDHEHRFGKRFRSQDVHPQTLLEEDAKEAFEVMYKVFRTLLQQTI
jgi:hypothetical protein